MLPQQSHRSKPSTPKTVKKTGFIADGAGSTERGRPGSNLTVCADAPDTGMPQNKRALALAGNTPMVEGSVNRSESDEKILPTERALRAQNDELNKQVRKLVLAIRVLRAQQQKKDQEAAKREAELKELIIDMQGVVEDKVDFEGELAACRSKLLFAKAENADLKEENEDLLEEVANLRQKLTQRETMSLDEEAYRRTRSFFFC